MRKSQDWKLGHLLHPFICTSFKLRTKNIPHCALLSCGNNLISPTSKVSSLDDYTKFLFVFNS